MPASSPALDPGLFDAVRRLVLQARGMVEGPLVGEHKSPFHGFSIEFRQHRPYSPGDDLRHLDWRVYARSERYVVKQYQQLSNYHGHVLLDASASMRFAGAGRSKLDYAKVLAVTTAFVMLRGRNAVGLGVFDRALLEYIPPSDNPAQLGRFLAACDARPAEGDSGIGPVLSDFARRVRRRGIVVVISDFFDDADAILAGVRLLRYSGHEVIFFQVLDRQEIDFRFDGAVRFRGLEGGGAEAVRCRPNELRAAYLRRFAEFSEKLKTGADRSGVDLVVMPTDAAVDAALAGYLAGRGKKKGLGVRG
jgi:uncharacterized protein (DUF58 family)